MEKRTPSKLLAIQIIIVGLVVLEMLIGGVRFMSSLNMILIYFMFILM